MRFVRVLIVVALIVSLFGNFVMYMKWSGKRPILSVNGQGISKRDLDSYLEVRGGQQVKADLVQEMLITQEAKKQGVSPTDQEVLDVFNEQRESNWQFAREIQMMPWKEDEAKKNIRLLLSRNRLLTKGITVTPDMIKEEYDRRPQVYDTPNKAHVELAVIIDPTKTENIKTLLEKPVSPSVIMQDMKGAAAFLGYENKLTLPQAFGTKQNAVIFGMKPNEVKVLPPGEFAKMGGKALVVRLIDIVPGHKADLNDPKTKEKLTMQCASQRALPWQQYLSKLWSDTKFESEDPNDKRIVEAIFFPDRARSASAR